MIKKTLYFENPVYLKTGNEQLLIVNPGGKNIIAEKDRTRSIAIEDIGMMIIDNPQITFTQALLAKLIQNNVAFVVCNPSHLPSGMFLNLDGHSLQSARVQTQAAVSLPLKKQLWQQTVKAKITNQSKVLQRQGISIDNMMYWANSVNSGDTQNYEGRAAAYYWKHIFSTFPNFIRGKDEASPNQYLNYGYAILRAMVARSLVGSGLLPTLGIHHRNQYNAYCLADDIMEPYRPYVDIIVLDIINQYGPHQLDIFTTAQKAMLLNIATVDVDMEGKKSPLMVALSRSTASLVKCYEGESRKLLYPEL